MNTEISPVSSIEKTIQEQIRAIEEQAAIQKQALLQQFEKMRSEGKAKAIREIINIAMANEIALSEILEVEPEAFKKARKSSGKGNREKREVIPGFLKYKNSLGSEKLYNGRGIIPDSIVSLYKDKKSLKSALIENATEDQKKRVTEIELKIKASLEAEAKK